MRLLSQGTLFAGTADTQTASSCFPAVARLLDGTLLTSWRVGSQKDSADGQILLSRSIDEGDSWSKPEELPAGPWAAEPGEVHYAPLTVLGHNHLLAALMWVDRSDPTLPFFNPTTEGLLPIRTWLCESRDGGRSWGDYRVMDGEPHDGPLAITGPALVLGDGRLACQFELNKPYEDTRPWRHAAAWMISRNGGHHWSEYMEVANDPTDRLMYWDSRYALGSNGHIVAAFWTYDRQQQRDRNIHLSESSDGGRNWSAPRNCGLIGQVCHPVLLGGDRLLLIYVDRFRTRGIRAALSNDLGRSFVEDISIYQHPAAQIDPGEDSAPAGYLQDMELWTFGRVEAIVGHDGMVWVVYYAGNSEATDIRWARLQVSAVRQSTEMHPHSIGTHSRRSAAAGLGRKA